jgi:hypothetical protein
MKEKKPISFEEFYRTCYHTQNYLHIPLLDRRTMDKRDYFSRGKYDSKKLEKALYEIYEQNLNRLNG